MYPQHFTPPRGNRLSILNSHLSWCILHASFHQEETSSAVTSPDVTSTLHSTKRKTRLSILNRLMDQTSQQPSKLIIFGTANSHFVFFAVAICLIVTKHNYWCSWMFSCGQTVRLILHQGSARGNWDTDHFLCLSVHLLELHHPVLLHLQDFWQPSLKVHNHWHTIQPWKQWGFMPLQWI